jgi:hypothetical protein
VRVGAEAGVMETFRVGVEALGLLAEGLRAVGVRGDLLFVEGLRFAGVEGGESSSWSGGFAIF